MARKRAANGYREYKITRLMDGKFEVTVRGIHQGEYFAAGAGHVDAKDVKAAMVWLLEQDVEKRGVKSTLVG